MTQTRTARIMSVKRLEAWLNLMTFVGDRESGTGDRGLGVGNRESGVVDSFPTPDSRFPTPEP